MRGATGIDPRALAIHDGLRHVLKGERGSSVTDLGDPNEQTRLRWRSTRGSRGSQESLS